jgi:hypothetical protein
MARAVAPSGLTVGRAVEIGKGHGAPATEQELAELAELETLKARIAPVLRKFLGSQRQRAQIRRGMAIYEGLSPIEQLRWGDRTPAALLTHVRAIHRSQPTLPAGRPRERRARSRSSSASRDGPLPPESEPPPVKTWRGLEAASVRMVQRCERRRAKSEAP